MPIQPASPIILIVDDHQHVRTSLKAWLVSTFPEFRFLDADSGERAVLLAKDNSLLLVLMDIGLPGMDGIEAARQIKSIQPKTKIVMLSIHDEQSYQDDAKKAGAAAFLSKSSMLPELIPMVKKLTRVRDEI